MARQGQRGYVSYLFTTLLLFLDLLLPAAATPASPRSVVDTREAVRAPLGTRSTCTKPTVRKEWRTLTVAERQSYIDAVKCLINKPALTSTSVVPGVTNRYEDFLGIHILQMTTIHFVGKFYPWHRLMLAAYEEELSKCGFEGGQPYWDWQLDNKSDDDFYGSPIFDSETGFGGNGAYIPGNFTHPAPGQFVATPWDIPDRTGGGCITSGPFQNVTVHLGPMENITYSPQCISRDLSPVTFANMTGIEHLEASLAQDDFGWFSYVSEYSVHGGGHFGVGGLYGDMSDQWSSPSDPIFYLHHSNLDRLWWSWQVKNLTARLTDISGPLAYMDYANVLAGNTTLSTEINVGNVTLAVSDVMSIQSDILCYEYEDLY